jgi:hypothetical protein
LPFAQDRVETNLLPFLAVLEANLRLYIGSNVNLPACEGKPEQKVGMEVIFRDSVAAGEIMDEAVEQFIPVIWTRVGVGGRCGHIFRAKENGATLILDRRPKASSTFLKQSESI